MPLLLKSLELQGYKTFASRTLFEFAEGITAIVGPNGSGKSNIADALRWVLGEQSYSLLRAKKTEDMIFSGSEARSRASMAAVTITFDNSNGWLPVDFSEVAISRRAYRDGRNEYLLNGQHVRLREINELLAQSGLSERTYTILGQGLVDASLALKADDRRRLFEEAAGVGLYRARREEALRRLETTERNLERVQDILAELEPRLRNLERQSKRASEYAQLQADMRMLLLEWYGYHWHHALKDLRESRELLQTQESRLTESRQNFQKWHTEAAAYRERLQTLRAQLNTWHRMSSELHAEREAASRQLAVLEERRRSLLETRQNLIAEQDRLTDEITLAQEKLSQLTTEDERLQAEHAEAQAQLTQAQQTLQNRQAKRAALEEEIQAARRALTDLQAQRAAQRARHDELAARLAMLEKRLSENIQALHVAGTAVRESEARLQTAQTRLREAEEEHKDTQSRLQSQRQQTEAVETEIQRAEKEHSIQSAAVSRLKAQVEVLEQAEQALIGYGEGARFLLEAVRQERLHSRHGALSTVLDVPVEYETAIAAALSDYLEAIVFDSEQDVEQALQLLEGDAPGRAALLPLAWLTPEPRLTPPNDPGCLGLAVDLVRAPAALQPVLDLLLGQVFVVRDRPSARRLVKERRSPYLRAVTLKGEVFRADGSVLAGKAAHSGTLSRPRQKRELQQTLAEAEERLTALNRQIENLRSQQKEARQKLASLEQRLSLARHTLDEALTAERQASLELESARRQQAWQVSQQKQLQLEKEQAENEQEALAQSQSQGEDEISQAAEAVRVLEASLTTLTLDEEQEQAAYWNTRLAVVARALEDIHHRQAERAQLYERLKEQKQAIERRLQEIGQALTEMEGERESLRQRESRLNEQIASLRVEIEPAEQELESAERQEIQLQEHEAEAQRSLSAAERAFAQAQLEVSRRQDALDNLRKRIEDDFGLVAFSYSGEITGSVPLPLDGMVEQLPVVTTLAPDLEGNLTQLRAQLRRMGPVNPEAKQEYDAEHDRFEFLTSQVADLRKAEADLREVIAELDELTKQEFQRTFQAVDKEFREIFVRLFGGGAARLALTEPENLVETGIEIEARLPGRREQGLALLSGGERSLTAIALVFALLKVSPTPVCVMDEVDAMLDEANVGRFRDLLAELSQETQFIIITHNRNTVQAADVIYGVTMGRDSASQVISLKLEEISDEMLGGRG